MNKCSGACATTTEPQYRSMTQHRQYCALAIECDHESERQRHGITLSPGATQSYVWTPCKGQSSESLQETGKQNLMTFAFISACQIYVRASETIPRFKPVVLIGGRATKTLRQHTSARRSLYVCSTVVRRRKSLLCSIRETRMRCSRYFGFARFLRSCDLSILFFCHL